MIIYAIFKNSISKVEVKYRNNEIELWWGVKDIDYSIKIYKELFDDELNYKYWYL